MGREAKEYGRQLAKRSTEAMVRSLKEQTGLAHMAVVDLGGGQRILFACGRASCLASARAAAGHLTRAGVPVQVVYAPNQGHIYAGKVQEHVAAAFCLADGRRRSFCRNWHLTRLDPVATMVLNGEAEGGGRSQRRYSAVSWLLYLSWRSRAGLGWWVKARG